MGASMTLVAFIGICISYCLFTFVEVFAVKYLEERKLDMVMTGFYIVHAIAGVIAVLITSIGIL